MKLGKTIYEVPMLVVGSLLYAAGIALFLDPNRLAPGGVTGISIIINTFTGVSTGLLILLLNIPLLILGVYKFGLRFFVSTIAVTFMTSGMVALLAPVGAVTTEPLLAAAGGAVLLGVGSGLIYRARATTGGVDILVRLLKQKYRHIKTGSIFFAMDALVIFCATLIFKNFDLGMYAAIATFISTNIFDAILYGSDGARMIYIISQHEREIAAQLMDELGTGVTYLRGEGAYTAQHKNVILCVVRKQNLPRVQEIMSEHDSEAFMIVASANEVFGEGYKSPLEERL